MDMSEISLVLFPLCFNWKYLSLKFPFIPLQSAFLCFVCLTDGDDEDDDDEDSYAEMVTVFSLLYISSFEGSRRKGNLTLLWENPGSCLGFVLSITWIWGVPAQDFVIQAQRPPCSPHRLWAHSTFS